MMFYRSSSPGWSHKDARLLRAAKGRLLPTRRATALLEASGTSDLFRIMFETAFWRINLAYFDGLPIDHWPQTHIGVGPLVPFGCCARLDQTRRTPIHVHH